MENKTSKEIDCERLFGCSHKGVTGTVKKIGKNITLQCSEKCGDREDEKKNAHTCCFLCTPMCQGMRFDMINQTNIDLARLKIISYIAKCRKNGK